MVNLLPPRVMGFFPADRELPQSGAAALEAENVSHTEYANNSYLLTSAGYQSWSAVSRKALDTLMEPFYGLARFHELDEAEMKRILVHVK